MKKFQLKQLIREVIIEELNKWGGCIVKDNKGNKATVSIWKTNESEFFSRIDFPDLTQYVTVKDHEGYRNAYDRNELYPIIKQNLIKRGFGTDGIENCKTKLSYTGNPINYINDPDYDADDHIKQAQFLQKIQKVHGDVKYRLSHPSEFDDKE